MRRIKNYFFNKLAKKDGTHPLYIIPTLDGLKVLSLNFLLLIIGLVYANNFVLLFNFILFCLCISSMFYTHFNLSQLQLEQMSLDSLFANEEGVLRFSFKTSPHGHHFLRFRIIADGLETLNNQFNLHDQYVTIAVPVKPQYRGRIQIKSLYVETVFPLNFFKCFTFLHCSKELIVYPERQAINGYWEIKEGSLLNDETADFHYREYNAGESMQRMDWKRFAKNGEMYLRQWNYNDQQSILLGLRKDFPAEEALKAICFKLFEIQNASVRYGLQLSDTKIILPGSGRKHLINCLEQLALYES